MEFSDKMIVNENNPNNTGLKLNDRVKIWDFYDEDHIIVVDELERVWVIEDKYVSEPRTLEEAMSINDYLVMNFYLTAIPN